MLSLPWTVQMREGADSVYSDLAQIILLVVEYLRKGQMF
jgi:hypothetical protein